MPNIRIEFYGAFREYAKEMNLSLPKNATLEDVFRELNANMPELNRKIEATETAIIVVNGRRVERGYVLQDGDVVKFFSSVLGG
ncbi:MAG: MoaD/ThiS family protein [Thermoplasmata archaeon]